MQRYTYMRLVEIGHYKKVFTGEFDAELLLRIIQVFQEQVLNNAEFNNEVEQIFLYEFLTVVQATPNFDFVLDFLGKKERDQINSVLAGLDKITEEQIKVLRHGFTKN